MNTREFINGLPEHVRDKIEQLRGDYTKYYGYFESDDEGYANTGLRYMDETRQLMRGYVLGLMHAGLIAERGRQLLFLYMTTPEWVDNGNIPLTK